MISLSRMQSLRIGAVLEDCSHQLDILGHCLTVQISKEQRDTSVQEENWLIKIKSECQSISRQMSKLSFELENRQSFSSLLQAVEKKKRKHKEKEKLNIQIDLEQKNPTERTQQKIQDMLDKLNELSLVWKELKDKTVKKKMAEMVSTKEEVNLKEETRQDETQQTKTLKAGTGQTETGQLKNNLQNQLELLQTQLREEKRAHEESVKFLQNRHKELEQQLHNWKQQMKEMLQDKQEQVNNFSRKRTVTLDRLMEMRRKFKEMEQVVMEDKREQEKLFQHEAEVRTATKLQAWWRGCMVRRGLGAFKKAEDKKTKKKKGKKKPLL